MMGHGGIMGTMGDMRDMSRMMDHCGAMMSRDHNRPNDQWRKDAPATPDKKG